MRRVRDLSWRYPEWWSLALSAAAWMALGALGDSQHHGSDAVRWAWWTATWLLMVVAMMVPLVSGSIHFTAVRSLWRRRHRAIAGFLAGFLGLWLLAGLAALGAAEVLDSVQWSRPAASMAGFILAAAWQHAPARQRALVACHGSASLAPLGWQADRDCIRYGWTIGRRCLVACWVVMLAYLAAGHGLLLMAGVTGVVMVERYSRRPNRYAMSGALAVLGAVVLCFSRGA
jgi:predicted metal-binding membrane protein